MYVILRSQILKKQDDALTFKGQLFAEDKVIIYDLTKGESIKRRNRKKADEAADQETENATEE